MNGKGDGSRFLGSKEVPASLLPCHDVLVGGRGNDILLGGAGSYLIIGGLGRDRLSASRTSRRPGSGDIVITGGDFGLTDAALRAIHAD